MADTLARTAVQGMKDACEAVLRTHPNRKLRIVTTGTTTNLALFILGNRELAEKTVEEIVVMGGAIGGKGNRGAAAEFNILCDPEAAQIVFDSPIRGVMIPLDVTHTAIFTPTQHILLLDTPTPLRRSISSILTHFASTYLSVFDFIDGPPCHDATTMAYLANPGIFKGARYRVDVERQGEFTTGMTVVDWWGERGKDQGEGWGSAGKNVWVATEMDVAEFWKMFHDCVRRADQVAAVNRTDWA